MPRDPGVAGVPLAVLREAVALRVADTGLRQTGREIGVSHQTLGRFLAGESEPYGSTVALVRKWYEAETNAVARLRQEVADLRRRLAECERKLRT